MMAFADEKRHFATGRRLRALRYPPGGFLTSEVGAKLLVGRRLRRNRCSAGARGTAARLCKRPRRHIYRMKKIIVISLAACVLAIAGCESVSTTNAGAVGVDRKQQMLVESETIEQGAAQAYEAELQKAHEKGILNTDGAQLNRVTTIARRIVKATPVFRPDAAKWNWQFNVEKTKELNAYCMPGGRIMVYSGLIDPRSHRR